MSFLFKKKEEPPKKVVVRLSLAWRDLREINAGIVEANTKTTDLDLSNNKIAYTFPIAY